LDIVEAVVELERDDVDEIFEDSSVIATTTSSISRQGEDDAASVPQKELLQYKSSNMSLPNLKTENGFVIYPHLFIPKSKKSPWGWQ
jgi:hypothetical protein